MGDRLKLPELLTRFDRIKDDLDKGKPGILKAHLNQAHRGILSHPESNTLDEILRERLQETLKAVQKRRSN